MSNEDIHDALSAAMEDPTLTEQERRNIAGVRQWTTNWSNDAAKMVDESYAETADVYLPMQGFHFAKRGEDMSKWRRVEIAAQAIWTVRKMHFVTVVARGDTVAIETGPATLVDKNGAQRHAVGHAMFLKFDEEGKIISDHTFMTTAGERKSVAAASDPDVRAALEAVHAAIIWD